MSNGYCKGVIGTIQLLRFASKGEYNLERLADLQCADCPMGSLLEGALDLLTRAYESEGRDVVSEDLAKKAEELVGEL